MRSIVPTYLESLTYKLLKLTLETSLNLLDVVLVTLDLLVILSSCVHSLDDSVFFLGEGCLHLSYLGFLLCDKFSLLGDEVDNRFSFFEHEVGLVLRFRYLTSFHSSSLTRAARFLTNSISCSFFILLKLVFSSCSQLSVNSECYSRVLTCTRCHLK